MAHLQTDLTEDELVEQILREWGASAEITEQPFGKSQHALQAMARLAVRRFTVQEWDDASDIPGDVDEAYTYNGLQWKRGHLTEWACYLEADELLDRFGTMRSQPPTEADFADQRAAVEAVRVHAGTPEASNGEATVGELDRLFQSVEEALSSAGTEFEAVATRSGGYLPRDHGSRAGHRATELRAALAQLATIRSILAEGYGETEPEQEATPSESPAA